MIIDRIKIENGWEIHLVEEILPGRPRYWKLVKGGYPELRFMKTFMRTSTGFPGIGVCKAVSEYIEENVKRGKK